MAAHPENDLTAPELADLRADYEAGASALTVLAARFALSQAALRALARRLNFGARPPAIPFQRRGVAHAPKPPAAAAAQTEPQEKAPVRETTLAGKRTSVRKKNPARKKTRARSKNPARKQKPAGNRKLARCATTKTPAAATPPPTPLADDAPLRPLDIEATAERLRRAAERRLNMINDQLEAGEDVERHARALSSLVKTLGDLARLADARAAAAPDDADGWSLDDLRETFARRMDAFAPPGSDG